MKIAITGPECAGKTTLAKLLGRKLNAYVVEEYARAYLGNLNRPYQSHDVEIIAENQFIHNNKSTPKTLIADTEMLVCKVWYEEKFNLASNRINQLFSKQEFDLYLLCKPDLPWEHDKLRENPTDRDRIFIIYKKLLEKHHPKNYKIMEGSINEREKKATEIISHFM